jgi:hypothetical protein
MAHAETLATTTGNQRRSDLPNKPNRANAATQ